RPSSRSELCQRRRSRIHHGDDQQINVAKESVELIAESLSMQQHLGDRAAIQAAAGLQQASQKWTVLGGTRWVRCLMGDSRFNAAKRYPVTHNSIGARKCNVHDLASQLHEDACGLFCRARHVPICTSRDERAIDADANLAHPLADETEIVRHGFMRSRRIIWIGASDCS